MVADLQRATECLDSALFKVHFLLPACIIQNSVLSVHPSIQIPCCDANLHSQTFDHRDDPTVKVHISLTCL